MPAFVRYTVTELPAEPRQLLGSTLRHKTVTTDEGIPHLMLGGWVVGRQGPVARVELTLDGRVVQTASVGEGRPQAAAKFPDTAWAATSGYFLPSAAIDPRHRATYELRAVLADGATAPLAVVQCSGQPQIQAPATSLRPLLVTSLARSGSTWMMRLLAEHPEIVVFRKYPYEMRPSLYWTNMYAVLAGNPDRSRPISHPKTFRRDKSAIGANPFHTDTLAQCPPLHEWSELTYAENVATFCQESIEHWYRLLGNCQDQPAASFFAEKRHPNEHLKILDEMYPTRREILLVRDFRDVATSALAFNEQRGHAGFGRDQVDSDEVFLASLRRAGDRLLEHWRRRADRAHLVRYEDLIRTPDDVLRGILTYLGLEASPDVITGMLDRATDANDELQQHRTSSTPDASIGRWRRDLEPSLRQAAMETFDELLTNFGYKAA